MKVKGQICHWTKTKRPDWFCFSKMVVFRPPLIFTLQNTSSRPPDSSMEHLNLLNAPALSLLLFQISSGIVCAPSTSHVVQSDTENWIWPLVLQTHRDFLGEFVPQQRFLDEILTWIVQTAMRQDYSDARILLPQQLNKAGASWLPCHCTFTLHADSFCPVCTPWYRGLWPPVTAG